MSQTPNEICLICSSNKKLKNLTDFFNVDLKFSFEEMIYKCFSIQFLGEHCGLKNKICNRCTENLRFCCYFRAQIEIAHQKLYRIIDLKSTGKEETRECIQQTRTVNFKNEFTGHSLNNTFILEENKTFEVPVKTEIGNDNDLPFMDENSNDNIDNCVEENDKSDLSDSDWSTNTDDILMATGFWNEIEKLKLKRSYKRPKLSEDCTQCPLCEEYYEDREKLQDHYDKHDAYPFICDVCGRSYTKIRGLQSHYSSKHNKEKFTCHQCGKTYTIKSSLTFHIKHIHLKMKLLTCPKCKMAFAEWSERQKHLYEAHGFLEEHECEKCGALFKRKSKLNYHNRRVHLKERNRFCEICPASFFGKAELKKHILSHTGVKNLHCQYCGKAFGHSQYLKEHLKIHLNIKNFKCDQCDKAFVQKCSLRGHIKTHHKY